MVVVLLLLIAGLHVLEGLVGGVRIRKERRKEEAVWRPSFPPSNAAAPPPSPSPISRHERGGSGYKARGRALEKQTPIIFGRGQLYDDTPPIEAVLEGHNGYRERARDRQKGKPAMRVDGGGLILRLGRGLIWHEEV